MRAAKKRGSLRRPNPACSRWPFSFDEEQLFNKKHAKCKIPIYNSHARCQEKRVPEEAESRVFPTTFYFWRRTAIQQKSSKMKKSYIQFACADPKREGPWGGRILRVPDDLLFLTKNRYSTKNMQNANSPRQNACANPKREGPWGGRIPRVPNDLLVLTKNGYSTKNMQNANSPETERMRGPKKRGSLRRPNPACSRWPFSFDEEQLFHKKHAKYKIPIYNPHAGPQK